VILSFAIAREKLSNVILRSRPEAGVSKDDVVVRKR